MKKGICIFVVVCVLLQTTEARPRSRKLQPQTYEGSGNPESYEGSGNPESYEGSGNPESFSLHDELGMTDEDYLKEVNELLKQLVVLPYRLNPAVLLEYLEEFGMILVRRSKKGKYTHQEMKEIFRELKLFINKWSQTVA